MTFQVCESNEVPFHNQNPFFDAFQIVVLCTVSLIFLDFNTEMVVSLVLGLLALEKEIVLQWV